MSRCRQALSALSHVPAAAPSTLTSAADTGRRRSVSRRRMTPLLSCATATLNLPAVHLLNSKYSILPSLHSQPSPVSFALTRIRRGPGVPQDPPVTPTGPRHYSGCLNFHEPQEGACARHTQTDSEGRDAPANPKPHTSHPLPRIRPTYTLQLGPFGTCPAGHTGGPYERWGRGGEDAIDYQPILLRKQAHCPDWNQPTPRHKRRQIIRLHPRRQSAAAGRSAWPVVPARQPLGVVVGSSGGVGAHGPSVRGQLAAGDDDVGEGKGWRGPSIEEGSGGDARIRIPSPLLTSSRARALSCKGTTHARAHGQTSPSPPSTPRSVRTDIIHCIWTRIKRAG